MGTTTEPQGIAFYSVNTDETRYARSEAQIQGYLNSSDMGINASRGQDKGWRLAPEWVEKVNKFRNNENRMALLVAKNNGKNPSRPQILYAIYGAELNQYRQARDTEEAPFEQKYRDSISNKSAPKAEVVANEPTATLEETKPEPAKPTPASKK